MKGKKYILGAMVLLALVKLQTPVYAADKSGLEKAEGKVDISLEEFTLDEKGREIPWKDMEHVMPGQEITKIPRITNLAAQCQVRAKIEMKMGKEVEIPVTPKMLQGMPKGWELRDDGYYYYDRKLKKGEKVELFRSFTIPDIWDTRYGKEGEITPYYTENSLDILVTVEAIGEEPEKEVLKTVRSPKTGDSQHGTGVFVLAAGISAAVFFAAAGKRRHSQE